jgi:hypothetical protein
VVGGWFARPVSLPGAARIFASEQYRRLSTGGKPFQEIADDSDSNVETVRR